MNNKYLLAMYGWGSDGRQMGDRWETDGDQIGDRGGTTRLKSWGLLLTSLHKDKNTPIDEVLKLRH